MFESTYEVQILLATMVKEWQSPLDSLLKDMHVHTCSLLRPCIPYGPADLVIHSS